MRTQIYTDHHRFGLWERLPAATKALVKPFLYLSAQEYCGPLHGTVKLIRSHKLAGSGSARWSTLLLRKSFKYLNLDFILFVSAFRIPKSEFL
jgi:hypothetical protein